MSQSRVSQLENDIATLQRQLYNLTLDFSHITPDLMKNLMAQVIQLLDKTYDKIALLADDASVNYAKAVQPLADLEIYISKAVVICVFSSVVQTREDVRECSEELEVIYAKAQINCKQRADVFNVLRKYEEKNYSAEKNTLHHEQQLFFSKLMHEYRRDGAYLTNVESKNKITNFKKEIADLSVKFQSNINNLKTNFIFSKQELSGLPETWFTKEREVEPNKFKVTLSYPDVFPILDYAKNRDVRKQIYLAFNTRCKDTNLSILTRVAQLRHQLANLLGYKNHAEYMAEIRITENPQNIRKFLDDMQEYFRPAYLAQLQKITVKAREIENNPNFIIENYDLAYYSRLTKESEFNLDMQTFDSYFPLEKVISGTLEIYQKILGLKFISVESSFKWHEDVKAYEVYNDDSVGEKIGMFYLDLHPREGKYTHAAAFDLAHGADLTNISIEEKNSRQLPIAAMVCNLPKSSNLSFDSDVTTFFHEFGHVMHLICCKTKLPFFFAFNTELDFVEAPSQMLENWCYDSRVLKFLSVHPETGEPVPQSMITQLKEMRKASDVVEAIRQLIFSNFDMAIHSLNSNDWQQLDILKCFQEIQRQVKRPMIPCENECPASSFAHMTGGYDVGYYGYMMTNTYAVDMFMTKFKDDPLCPKRGMEYRKTILEPGASIGGINLIKNFLGRAPQLDAYLNIYGLEAKKNNTGLNKLSVMSQKFENIKDNTEEKSELAIKYS